MKVVQIICVSKMWLKDWRNNRGSVSLINNEQLLEDTVTQNWGSKGRMMLLHTWDCFSQLKSVLAMFDLAQQDAKGSPPFPLRTAAAAPLSSATTLLLLSPAAPASLVFLTNAISTSTAGTTIVRDTQKP